MNLFYAPRALRYKVMNLNILKDMWVSNQSCLEGKKKPVIGISVLVIEEGSGWASGWMILLFPIESL